MVPIFSANEKAGFDVTCLGSLVEKPTCSKAKAKMIFSISG